MAEGVEARRASKEWFSLSLSVQRVSNAGEFLGKLWGRVDRTPVETLENIRVCHLWEITEPTRSVFNRTHNRSVAGSIPARPTNRFSVFRRMPMTAQRGVFNLFG